MQAALGQSALLPHLRALAHLLRSHLSSRLHLCTPSANSWTRSVASGGLQSRRWRIRAAVRSSRRSLRKAQPPRLWLGVDRHLVCRVGRRRLGPSFHPLESVHGSRCARLIPSVLVFAQRRPGPAALLPNSIGLLGQAFKPGPIKTMSFGIFSGSSGLFSKPTTRSNRVEQPSLRSVSSLAASGALSAASSAIIAGRSDRCVLVLLSSPSRAYAQRTGPSSPL